MCTPLSRDCSRCTRTNVARLSLAHTHTHTRARATVGSLPSVMILPLASWLAGISRRRRRNVWHSLSQYVTHHPRSPSNRVTTSIFPWCTATTASLMHAISVTNDLAVRRTANWMPRNYETRNNSGGPKRQVVTPPSVENQCCIGDWSFSFFLSYCFFFDRTCNENFSFVSILKIYMYIYIYHDTLLFKRKDLYRIFTRGRRINNQL